MMDNFKTPIKKKNEKQEDVDKITIPPSPFLNRLGYGTGVSVMQLVRSPKAGVIRSPWALKMINKRVKPDKVFAERLTAEAALLKRMSHPNIVGFRAFNKDKRLFLGMESCDVSLGDMIEKRAEDSGEIFSPKQILKVANDVGNGLDYLHTCAKLLHADMKSYNVLVNGDFNICKICDFGVALPLDENGKLDTGKGNTVYYGTEAWSAPEVINGEEISSKTDIWPLGLVFWEMMALAPPHSLEDSLNASECSMRSDAEVSQSSEDFESHMFERYGTRPLLPTSICKRQFADPLALFFCCTQHSPAARPSAAQLASAAHERLSTNIND